MKFLTNILTFTVIILSVKSGIDAIPFALGNQSTCCSITKCSLVSENQNSEKQEEKGRCNPLQACGSCTLFCLRLPVHSITIPEILTTRIFGYQSFSSVQFISDFWQPPKFV